MTINEQARLEINLELEALKRQRTKTAMEHQRKVALIKWPGEVKALIDHVEEQ